jgi:hypothetical protein
MRAIRSGAEELRMPPPLPACATWATLEGVLAALLYLAAVVGALHAVDGSLKSRRRPGSAGGSLPDAPPRPAACADAGRRDATPRAATPYRTAPPPPPAESHRAEASAPTPVASWSVVTALLVTWLAGSAIVHLFHGCSR